MIARNAMHSIQHVRSHYTDWFLGEQEIQERLESIVLIGLQEKLPQDFEYLKKQLCLPPSVQLPEDEVLAHRTPKGFNRRLSPMAERNLQEWYADDIRFYDFCLRARESRGLHGVARLSAK